MKMINKMPKLVGIALVVIMALFFAACDSAIDSPGGGGAGAGGNGGGGGGGEGVFVQIPPIDPNLIMRASVMAGFAPTYIAGEGYLYVPTRQNGKLLAAFTDGTHNFFVIHTGTIRDVYMGTKAHVPHLGVYTRVEKSTVSEVMISAAAQKAFQNHVSTTDTRSETHTANAMASMSARGGVFSASVRTSWEGSWANASTRSLQESQTLSTSETIMNRMINAVTVATVMDHTIPAGTWRLAWYGNTRFYLKVQTTRDNQQLESIRPIAVLQPYAPFFTRLYRDGSGSAQDETINFEYRFYRFLETPEDYVIPEWFFDFDAETGTITSYTGDGGDIIIPAIIGERPVTNIGYRAFQGRNLTSVVIPNTVREIRQHAFASNQLTSVTIPHGVTWIATRAFYGNQLGSVIIPNTVTRIGTESFRRNRLESITIGNSVDSIGPGAFQDNWITSVEIPNRVRTIETYAFRENRLESVTIGTSVAQIGNSAFSGNRLTSVRIPPSVTSMGSSAFSWNLLTNVEFPYSIFISGGLTRIPYGAFFNNRLRSITLSHGLRYIDANAFGGHNYLTNITIRGGVTLANDAIQGGFAAEYRRTDARGGPGTYTRPNPTVNNQWRRQQ